MSKRRTPQDRESLKKAVLDGMAKGLSAYKATQAAGVPWGTWTEWVATDDALAVKYTRARETLVERMAQELADIADEPPPLGPDGKVDNGWVAKHRLQVDTRKWLLSKLAPRKYGERLEVAGDASAPLQAAVTVSFVKPGEK
jgi:hypothetical protein